VETVALQAVRKRSDESPRTTEKLKRRMSVSSREMRNVSKKDEL
jgi:hypothetical protein